MGLCQLLTGCGAQAAPAADASWRAAYIGLLERVCEEEKDLRNPERPDYEPGRPQATQVYYLYDVDKDGVPELFLRSDRMGYETRVYTAEEGQAVEVGMLESRDIQFYTCPEEPYIVAEENQRGYFLVYKIGLSGGALDIQEPFYETDKGAFTWADGSDAAYPGMTALLPDSVYLQGARALLEYPELAPQTLPIEDYGKERNREPEPGQDAAARAAIAAVLEGSGRFYAVTGDGWCGDVGWTTLADYLQPGGVTEYAELPLTVTARTWADVNEDGQAECLLRVRNSKGDYASNTYTVILSEQAGTVYAYCLSFGDYEVGQSGTLRGEAAQGAVRLSFRENQCYFYPAAYDETAPLVVWEAVPELMEMSAPQDWQAAYKLLLEEVCQAQSEGLYSTGEYQSPAVAYCLYDLDENGIPEMLIQYGTCEAEYYLKAYAFRDGSAVSLGQTAFGHSRLYTWPGEPAALLYGAQMGYMWLEKLEIQDGQLMVEHLSEGDAPDGEYPPAEDIVPRAKELRLAPVLMTWEPAHVPMTMLIDQYGLPEEQYENAAAAEALEAVKEGGARFYGVFCSDASDAYVGLTTLAEYCQAAGASLRDSRWMYLDQNSQQEMLLALQMPEGEEYLALSWQAGAVYGYRLGGPKGTLDWMPNAVG